MRSVLGTRKAGRVQPRGRGAGWIVALMAGMVCLGACQSEPSAPHTAPLAERVTAFWEARIKGDDVAAYQYETYAHTGEMTVTQYVQARSPMLKYKAYTIDTIQEQEQEAQVTVNLQYHMTVPGMLDTSMTMPIEEQWVRLDDSQWYRNVKPIRPGQVVRQPG